MEKKFVNILAETKPLKENEYRCGHCGEVNEYDKDWTDADANKEAEQIFGKPVSEWDDTPVVICDDCFQKMHPLKAENVDKLLKARAQI